MGYPYPAPTPFNRSGRTDSGAIPRSGRRTAVQPLVQTRPDLVRREFRPLPLVAGDDDSGGRHAGQTRDAEQPPQLDRLHDSTDLHGQDSFMTDSRLSLDEAVDLTRTGDLWLFRGHSTADHAIRVLTNAPVNHVGMAVVIDDLPPLMWHAELGKGLPCVWTGKRQRVVQLHDLRDAVTTWTVKYGARAWLRQLVPEATAALENAVFKTIARP